MKKCTYYRSKGGYCYKVAPNGQRKRVPMKDMVGGMDGGPAGSGSGAGAGPGPGPGPRVSALVGLSEELKVLEQKHAMVFEPCQLFKTISIIHDNLKKPENKKRYQIIDTYLPTALHMTRTRLAPIKCKVRLGGQLIEDEVSMYTYYLGLVDGTHFNIPEYKCRSNESNGIHLTDRSIPLPIGKCDHFSRYYNGVFGTERGVTITGVSSGAERERLCKFYFNHATTCRELLEIIIKSLHAKMGQNDPEETRTLRALYQMLEEIGSRKVVRPVVLKNRFKPYREIINTVYLLALIEKHDGKISVIDRLT